MSIKESNVAIRGLTVQQIADASDDTQSANGNYAIVNMGLTKKTGFLVENCLIQNCYRGYFSNFGAVNASSCDNITVKNVTIRNIIGHSGINLGGPDASGVLSTTIWADRNHCEDIERTGVRFAGAENAVASFNKYSGTSSAAHANMTNATGKSHNILFHTNNFSGGINGYCPFQQASRMHYTANLIAAASDARAIVDQNSAAGTPISRAAELGVSGDGAVLCNTISPHQVVLTNPGAVTLGKAAYPEVTFILHNNIMPGVLPNAAITANSYNVVTGTGATLGANDTATTHGAVFADAASGDISIKAGSPSRSHTTKSLTAEIAVIKSRFPWFTDIDLDMHGRTINWASPPAGCAVNPDDVQPVRPVAIHQGPNTASIRPSVSGTPQQGGTLTVSGGYVRGAPFSAFAWQWQKSTNGGATWSDISGATALTYTIQPGDVGSIIRCRMTSGASVSYTAPTATVVSGYAIDNPAVLAGSTSDYVNLSASATARQMTFPSSGSLTTNGKTLFLAVPCRQNNATGTVWTVATIGAPGRAFGTGTALTLIETVIRAPSTVSIFMVTGLAAGSYTIQLQNAAGSEAYNVRCNVFEMGGVVSAGTPGTAAGGTGVLTLAPTITTTAANSMVLHTLIRGSGVADDATVTGATEFLEVDSGGTNAGNDVKAVLAYEAAATTGAYAGTFTWSVAVSASARSVELKS
ncbi:MAG: hypothetical protein IPL91_14985 [Hyphomicrobium sp.]|nr:hypothetical protein [Hyphomicrobium sp.]